MALRHRIHDAAKRGSIQDVEALLNSNPDLVNDKGEDEWTPLFRAAYNGRQALVELLVERGASVGRDADEWQNTPLHACCINGHREVAEFLLSKGAPLDENDNVGGWTPLFSAVYFGWPELVQLLVEAGADTELCDREGKKPIDVVCQAGYRPYNKPVIEALLQRRPVPAVSLPSPPKPPASSRSVVKPSAPYVSASASSEGSHRPVRLSISSLSQPISAVTISNPPPYLDTSRGDRVYFPMELSNLDYARRAQDLLQDLLLSLFESAVQAGRASPLPSPSNPFKPYLDAYDLLELAVKHQDLLTAYLRDRPPPPPAATQRKEGEGTVVDGGVSTDERTLSDRLLAVGQAVHRASHCHDDVARLLDEIRGLAVQVQGAGGSHVLEVGDLSEQFHTHYRSRQERLRFLRLTHRVDEEADGGGRGNSQGASSLCSSSSAGLHHHQQHRSSGSDGAFELNAHQGTSGYGGLR